MGRPLIAVMCNLEGYAEGERTAVVGAEGWGYKQGIGGCYVDAVWDAGGLPVLVPCLGEAQAVEEMLGRADGLVITGGADVAPRLYGAEPSPHLGGVNPYRDAADALAVAHCLARPELPVLGLCRGIQSYNAFAGGTLIQDIPSEVPGAVQHAQKAPSHEVSHGVAVSEPDSVIAEVLGGAQGMVNSFHHQAVRDVAAGLAVTARAPDGVVEALERPEARWTVLVQWHPEHMYRLHESARRLFGAFVAACR
jgi:putative glutamine amidotransferase